MKKTAQRQPLSLFTAPAAEPAPFDFDARLRAFACAAAGRGRGAAPDAAAFVRALRGYHRAWSICARGAVPALDERAVALAVEAYRAAKAGSRRPAA